MKKSFLLLLLATLALFILAACSPAAPIAIESVTLARDDGSGEPGETVTSFSPEDHIFHATIQLNRIEGGLKVRLVWIAADAGGEQNTMIDQTEFTGLAVNTIHGEIELPNDWPTGAYKLEIYLNDELKQTVDFTVA